MKGSMRVMLTLAGIVVVAAGVTLLVILPLRARTSSDYAAIEDRRTQLVKLQRVARRINDLQQEITRLEDSLAFFENRLPEEREIDVILREVWLIAEAKSLAARSIRTKASEVMPRYNSQPINMTLEGKFPAFYDFLLSLERLPRITKVRQMQITKSPLAEGEVTVDLMMDIFFESSK